MNGMPAYDVAIKANLNKFTEVVNEMEAILGSNELNDNQAPSVTAAGKAVVELNADLAAIDWTQYFTAEDGFDGVMDPALAAYDFSGVDAATAGTYKAKATFTDKTGNAGSAEVDVVVYDPANTVAPTLTLVEEIPTIALDAESVDWTTFVAEAKDVAGVALTVEADDSMLDVSMPDYYTVILSVTDYAGNTTSVEVEVEVVVE